MKKIFKAILIILTICSCSKVATVKDEYEVDTIRQFGKTGYEVSIVGSFQLLPTENDNVNKLMDNDNNNSVITVTIMKDNDLENFQLTIKKMKSDFKKSIEKIIKRKENVKYKNIKIYNNNGILYNTFEDVLYKNEIYFIDKDKLIYIKIESDKEDDLNKMTNEIIKTFQWNDCGC